MSERRWKKWRGQYQAPPVRCYQVLQGSETRKDDWSKDGYERVEELEEADSQSDALWETHWKSTHGLRTNRNKTEANQSHGCEDKGQGWKEPCAPNLLPARPLTLHSKQNLVPGPRKQWLSGLLSSLEWPLAWPKQRSWRWIWRGRRRDRATSGKECGNSVGWAWEAFVSHLQLWILMLGTMLVLQLRPVREKSNATLDYSQWHLRTNFWKKAH